MKESPRALGYRMPAEWEPHAATWLSWPHKEESWPGKFAAIPEIFVEIVRLLSPCEEVDINVNDAAMEKSVKELLVLRGVSLENVRLHLIPTNDAWCRDHGPVFVVRNRRDSRELAIVDWVFNSWGGKYLPHDLDDQVPARVAEVLGLPCFAPGIIMEGGSIDVNGRGTLLTTESCLLNPNRNPHLSRKEIEEYLREYLGATNILWLGEGIAGDDTDGHVDDLARFANPSTVVTAVEEDPSDENYGALKDNLRRLKSMNDEAGSPLEIVTLPMPPAVYYEGQRMPASYVNYYIANGIVLMPAYHPVTDPIAIGTLERLFPTRRVVGLDCNDLVWGLGAFHCVTQQQPAWSSGSSLHRKQPEKPNSGRQGRELQTGRRTA